MNINFRQLRAFLTVAETGSFTRASEALHITQPTLSVIIRDLEQALELRLFERTTRTVSLTAAGRELLPDARRLLRDLDSTVDSLRDFANRRRGVVSIAALPSVVSSWLPALLQKFRQQYPGITLRIRDTLADPLSEAVLQGQVDLGIGILVGNNPETLSARTIARDRLVVLIPVDHPLAGHARLDWRTLARQSVIAMNPETSVRYLTNLAFAQADVNWQPFIEVSHMASAIAMVREGLGVSVLPSSAMKTLNTAGVVMRDMHRPVMERDIVILTRTDRWLPPAAQAFLHLLEREGPLSSQPVMPAVPG